SALAPSEGCKNTRKTRPEISAKKELVASVKAIICTRFSKQKQATNCAVGRADLPSVTLNPNPNPNLPPSACLQSAGKRDNGNSQARCAQRPRRFKLERPR